MEEQTFTAARQLIEAFADGLAQRGGEGVGETLARLAEQEVSRAAFAAPAVQEQLVCRYLDQVIGVAHVTEPGISLALANLAPHLRWIQSASYTDDVLGEGFLRNYAWCEIIGAQGFFRGDDFNLGFLLLGPHRHYLDHYHPAPELYLPLTGGSKWKKGNAGFEIKLAGSVIWHPSMTVHAMITEDEPLLAAFAWTRHALVGARLSVAARP